MNSKKLLYFFSFIPALVLLLVSYAYSQNFPFNDDFPTILDFTNKYGSKSISLSLIKEMASSYGEHRLFFIKFISYLQLNILGKINFIWLTVIGNLSFILFYFLILKNFVSDKSNSIIGGLTIGLLLLQIQAWSNYIWAMSALENTLVFLWVGLSFHFAFFDRGNNNLNFAISILFSIFATYTNGNGIFVFFIIGFILLLNKTFKYSFLNLLLFIGFFFLNNANNSESLTSKIKALNISKASKMFFAFIGSNFYHPSFYQISIGIGFILTVYIAIVFLKKQYFKSNPFFSALILFIFITAMGVVTQRDNLDITTIAPSRYRVYGSLLLALVFISYSQLFTFRRETIIRCMIFPLSLALWSFSYYVGIDKMKNRQDQIQTTEFLFQNNISYSPELVTIYQTAIDKGILSISKNSIHHFYAQPISAQLIHNNKQKLYEFDTIIPINNAIIVKGWSGFNDNENSLNKPVIIGWKDSHISVFKAKFIEVNRFISSKENLKYVNCGIFAVVNDYKKFDSLYIGFSREVLLSNVFRIAKIPIE